MDERKEGSGASCEKFRLSDRPVHMLVFEGQRGMPDYSLTYWLISSIVKLIKGGAGMITTTATATETRNNCGRDLSPVMSGQEVVVTGNGREVGRLVPGGAAVS